MAPTPARLTILVCAFNEEANIGPLLKSLLAEAAPSLVASVIVVSSGSTDGTNAIVEAIASREPRLRLLAEAERWGKVAAVNSGLALAETDLVAIVDADCRPEGEALDRLSSQLERPDIGGVGSRNVPVNGGESWVARAGAVMWELHHLVNLRSPLLGGDVVIFRRVFEALPEESVNDDYVIESLLRSRGYDIAYAPEARVQMRAPTTVADFVRQRRRVHAGFFQERRLHPTPKSTQDLRNSLAAARQLLRRSPGSLPALLLLAALDSVARLWGYGDAMWSKDRHRVWQPAASTKKSIDP